jgi:hypothetical protein
MIQRTLLLFLLASQNSQTTFDFHSSFWVNLHHTLYNQAFVQRVGRAPDLSVLNPTEVAAWNEAVAYYGESVINHDFLESDMGRINAALARAGNATSLGTPHEITKDLAAILEKVAPIYRAHWWPDHDRKNREWIAAATPLVAKHEAVLKPALARAFDTPWEKRPIHVEMSYYVTNASAYTAIFPTLITVSSSSPRTVGPAMVEVLFHESSHALIVKARDELSKETRNRKTELPYPDFWHALLFYTNSEIVKKQLPELEPYANKYGMWQNNWPLALPVFEKDWRPFLIGKGNFREALKQIVADSAK